ncbi:MAG: roadblock/LC7 domain-containing protein [Acidobacteriota bacterium]|jgi:predicted regulator of Ras-like GTPase activity (Roadblock/LC7/MglB family)|nr:roadblock/LC7 domain-containing protein [Acidobacteriota bacterium]
MVFKDILKQTLERTEGALGALIMGMDGIAVEKYLLDAGRDANLDVAAAEFNQLLRNAQRAGKTMGYGALNEMVVSLDNMKFVMRLLSADYFIVLAIEPDGNFGRGRFELRKAELDLAREFIL